MSEAELDYYKILGVSRNAPKVDICRAYALLYLVTKNWLSSTILASSMTTKINHTKNSA